MQLRRFAQKIPAEFTIPIYGHINLLSKTKTVVKYILNRTVEFDGDKELFDKYVANYEEAFKLLELIKMDLEKYLDTIFGPYTEKSFEVDPYRAALYVDAYTDVEYIDGFIEIPYGEVLAFREKQLKNADLMVNAFPEMYPQLNDENKTEAMPLAATFQVTDDCNLCCTYCYQISKDKHVMSKEVADKAIDMLLHGSDEIKEYIDYVRYPSMELELIGGEGLLYPELNDYIVSKFITTMINENHPWLYGFLVGVGTNGVNYFTEPAQKFLNKWREILSVNITVDGNKALHDKCRLFPNGEGSYELAHKAVMYEMEHNYGPATKVTMSPDNIPYIRDAVISLVEDGFPHIWFNAIFEHEWTKEEAKNYLESLKSIIDYLISNNLYNHVEINVLSPELSYKPLGDDNKNWCGGDGRMFTVDYKGDMYNCLRYMESSLGNDQPPISIGNIYDGIGCTEEARNNIKCMRCINRRSQSTDECYYCPIASGCAWCSAYNYQRYGTPNKRSTNICNIHKAEAIATAYFTNTIAKLEGTNEFFDLGWVEDKSIFDGIIDVSNFNKEIGLED